MSKSSRLPDGSVWPTGAERIGEIQGRLHHAGDYDAAEIVAAYNHLLAHPAGVESAVAKLRMLRRVEREGGGS